MRDMAITYEECLEDVLMEIVRVVAIHPMNLHRLAVFHEESGELAKALLDNYEDPSVYTSTAVYCEAIQAAAMAVRLAVEGDDSFAYSPLDVVRAETVVEEEASIPKGDL